METWQRKDDETITVEAVRLNEENAAQVAAWCNADLVEEIDPEHPQETQAGLNVWTFQGMKRASLGVYVVKFANHFYVYNVRPFELAYTPVNRDSPPPESIGDSRKARGFSDPFQPRRSTT